MVDDIDTEVLDTIESIVIMQTWLLIVFKIKNNYN